MGYQMTTTTKSLISLLGKGEQNAVPRNILAALMGMDDRSMRRAISYARLEGVCIANTQNGKGYFLPDSREEYKRQYKLTEHRGKVILAQLKALRQAINEDENQMDLEDWHGNGADSDTVH